MNCTTINCTNEAVKGRTKCYKCTKEKYRMDHPVEASYQNLRSGAKRRGKVFTLTLEEFREFCVKYDYIQGKGIQKESLHVDRINELAGYAKDNLQILTNSENKKKYLKFAYRDQEGAKFKVFKQADENDTFVPF